MKSTEGSRRQLVRDKIEAQGEQKKWFTLMAAITMQMGGSIRVTKNVLQRIALEQEMEVAQDMMSGDLIISLVGYGKRNGTQPTAKDDV
jgi:hypothetical protein